MSDVCNKKFSPLQMMPLSDCSFTVEPGTLRIITVGAVTSQDVAHNRSTALCALHYICTYVCCVI